ncbi:mCpol domain-containing protein [Kamptonema sp. UHCC 0994]|uniref:mCpol domain-containing protein n=1 Tax=Kamptonema sp. UHCC 0994 TaxID=3031329 RepID=UPI0023B92332|nr:mCpol domain-containing protein [Kamptonema sp. UHCC 0994]MDF0551671.1 mCpol domain-containing protein [Kamptonema sp. UHCC 0994]
MNALKNSFKLIMGGNTNISAMINAIIRATLEFRKNENDDKLTFRQIHIFHTEQSLQSLIGETKPWQSALNHYGISSTSFVHHVTKLEDSNVERFRDMLEQLRTIIDSRNNDCYYVDLTGGISSLQAILAVFSYVLDIEHIYTLETQFSSDGEARNRQRGLFYDQLEDEIETGEIKINYRKFPPIRDFDEFGKLNYTEILRYRNSISALTEKLVESLAGLKFPLEEIDINHLQASFLSGVNSRLMGETTGNIYDSHNSIYSFSSGIEEITNIIIRVLIHGKSADKTLGDKMKEIRDFFETTPQYFVNEKILGHFTYLMKEIRNEASHPNKKTEKKDIVPIQSYLTSHLAFTFLQFTIKTLAAFVVLDKRGNLLEYKILRPPHDTEGKIFYFGLDGDGTGKYLELAFGDSAQDESEVFKRSRAISKAIEKMSKLIWSETKDSNSVIFAEGDNILFKSQYNESLLSKLQKEYRSTTDVLTSSIGFGETLREVSRAMKLAKAQQGDSIVGIALKEI